MLLVDSFEWIPNYGLRTKGMTVVAIRLRECCWLDLFEWIPNYGLRPMGMTGPAIRCENVDGALYDTYCLVKQF